MKKRFTLIGVFAVLFMLLLAACKTTPKYTVTFDVQGGTKIEAVKVEKGKTVTKPADPTRDGFDFDGWFETKDGNDSFDFTKPIERDTTIFAKWSAKGLSDQEIVDQVHAWLDLGDITALKNDSPRLILASQRDNATITWVIDKDAYISKTGVITQPDNEEGDQVVTLTATIQKGSVTKTKEFKATVVALPPLDEQEALINEGFMDYEDGDIKTQTDGLWAPVSGKSGTSTFIIVSDKVEGKEIPEGSKALKLNSWTEHQIETNIQSDLDFVVYEVDLLQTPGAGSIQIQNETGGDRVTFAIGITGSQYYYRIGSPNPQIKIENINADDSEWHRLRAEVDLANKTFELFIYENGNLRSLSGLVTYNGVVDLSRLIIRTGSSSETALRGQSSYITNIHVNRLEALPRPETKIVLGEISGIEVSKNIETGTPFTADNPIVKGLYGNQDILVLDTDYTLEVLHEIDINVAGEYEVTYKFTNKHDGADVKEVKQTIAYYDKAAPNQIQTATATEVMYEIGKTDLSLSLLNTEGILYYAVSHIELEAAEVKEKGTAVDILDREISIEGIEITNADEKIYLVVENEVGFGTVKVVDPKRQEVVQIKTAEEFHQMTTSTDTKYYVLVNDIDFDGFTWTYENIAFKGTFNGQNFTVKNISINGGDRLGIFARTNGATIKNLIIEDSHFVSSGRAGVLVGEVVTAKTTIENIVVSNTSVEGANDNGVAGLVAFVNKSSVEIRNVAVIDVNVTTSAKTASSLVGRIEGAVGSDAHALIEDVYVSGGIVKSTSTGTSDVGVSALLGYLRNANSTATVKRALVENVSLIGPMAGVGVGYIRDGGTATFEEVYLNANITFGDVRAGVIGRYNGTSERINLDDTFGYITYNQAGYEDAPHSESQLLNPTHILKPENVTKALVEANFTLDTEVWDIKDTGLPILKIASTLALPSYLVTIEFESETGLETETYYIKQGNPFVFTPKDVTGFEFVGLFTDVERSNALSEDFVVMEAVTLYAKYNAKTTATVTFDTDGGDLVDPVVVNIGDTLTEFPAVPNKEFEGVMKKVTGWTLDGSPFELTTTINSDITLKAVWEEVTYTVKVDGISQTVPHGALAVKPETNPVHERFPEQIEFKGWIANGAAFDFLTPITSDLVVTAKMGLVEGQEALNVSTPDDLHYALSNLNGFTIKLADNLDLSSYEWTPITNKFEGILDGNDKVLKGLTTNDAERSALLPYGNNVTIKNLVVEDANVVSTGERNGILISEVEKGVVNIENVIVKNSQVTGTGGNGTGGLIGFVKGNAEVNITNVALLNNTITNANEKYAGAFVGRVEKGLVNIKDSYAKSNTVTTNRTGTDAGSAGVIGYIRYAETVATLKRVVVDGFTGIGDATGAVFGYNRDSANAVLEDVFVKADLQGVQRSAGIVTRYNPEPAERIDASDVFGILTGTKENTQSQQLDSANNITEADLTAAWWNANFTLDSTLWDVPETGVAVLKIAQSHITP